MRTFEFSFEGDITLCSPTPVEPRCAGLCEVSWFEEVPGFLPNVPTGDVIVRNCGGEIEYTGCFLSSLFPAIWTCGDTDFIVNFQDTLRIDDPEGLIEADGVYFTPEPAASLSLLAVFLGVALVRRWR